MKKLGLIKRLFWSTTKITEYLGGSEESTGEIQELYERLLATANSNLENKNQEIQRFVVQIEELKSELAKYKAETEASNKNLQESKDSFSTINAELDRVKALLNEKTNANNNLQKDIHEKLSTLQRIEKTFFAASGNKGKGELGERQVKNILEKSGLPQDFWEENLIVGNKTVEFAIKSGTPGKYIPVDSKVLDAELDEDGKLIINDKYRDKVKAQARAVAEYSGKQTTTDYGVLVLQSDDIYFKLFEEYPTFFQDVIKEFKIFIASPSSFIQMAWNIANIIEIYEKVKSDEKIYADMQDALESVAKFANKLHSVHKDFNIAMKHYGTIENKHEKLSKRLIKTGKVTNIKSIDFKEKDDE